MRVLDFDTECRPLSWINSDYVSKEITAIAWAWTDTPEDVQCVLLGELTVPEMLRAFCAAYNGADLVAGHFIRGHDLPLLNGALMEHQLPVLADKMTQDTKCDLAKRAGISASQENLAAMLLIDAEKIQMNQTKWREANRLTPEGLAEARKRVIGDVRQNMEMRQRLLALGYLSPAKMWRSGTATVESYTP